VTRTTIVGSYTSPYVRKVLVCLDRKGLDYEIDPIVPFFGNDAFERMSPLRRIPVLIDDAVTLPDSTAICEYLDDRHPEPALRPSSPAERARARWLEEYADTRMGDVFVWGLFNERVIKPYVWGVKSDEERVRRTLEVDVPDVLDFLERELPREGFAFGPAMGIADIAIASFFRNAAFAGFAVDALRWPATAAFVERAFADPAFARLRPFEDLLLRTPIARQRDALRAAGAPVCETTHGSAQPRRGPLTP